MLALASGEWVTLILLGIYTMQRLGDLAKARWSQIENGCFNRLRSKHRSRAVIPLHPDLVAHLETLKRGKPQDPVLPGCFAIVEAQKRVSSLSNQFNKLLVAAGLLPPRSKASTGAGHTRRRKTNPYSFHSLRHTGNTWLKQGGASEAIAMDIVGHETSAMSQTYTHIDDGTKRHFIGRLPSILSASTGNNPSNPPSETAP